MVEPWEQFLSGGVCRDPTRSRGAGADAKAVTAVVYQDAGKLMKTNKRGLLT